MPTHQRPLETRIFVPCRDTKWSLISFHQSLSFFRSKGSHQSSTSFDRRLISSLTRSTMIVVAGNTSVGARRRCIQPRRRSIIFHLLLSAVLVVLVEGHGHMTSPRSRNWLATAGQDGVNSATPEKPDAEYCTHCLNVNDP